MEILAVAAQTIGIAAMVITVLSFQCRSNRNYFLCQEFSGAFFTVSFLIMGAWSGALMNLFGIVRPELLRREKFAKSGYTLLFLIAFLIACTLTVALISNEKWYLILMTSTAQLAGTLGMWTRNGKTIRLCQLFVVSPLWLIYDAAIPIPSIGGILTEIINIISVFLALYRYRKIGFTER